jgi:hypothetical protein
MVEEKALLAGMSGGRKRLCRSYQCMWLASQDGAAARGESPLPASMRPDRSKVMIEMGGPKGTNLVLHVDPGRPA